MLFAERKLPWGDGTATFTDAAPSLVVSKETGSVEMLADGLIAELTEHHRHITLIDPTGHILRYFTREGVTPVFGLGFVPASREAKMRLGVSKDLLDKEGEHSHAATHALVDAVWQKMKNDTVVAVNGKYLVWSDPENENTHHEFTFSLNPNYSEWEKRQSVAHQTFATILGYLREENIDVPFASLPEPVLKKEDETMVREIVATIRKQGWRFATVESCTGGTIADIYSVFDEQTFAGSVVPYSDIHKQLALGIEPILLPAGFVYSKPTATRMAGAGYTHTGADVIISSTGVTNKRDTREKYNEIDPGVVFSTIIVNGNWPQEHEFHLEVKPDDRDSMKVDAAMHAFRALHGFLKEKGLLEIIPPEIPAGG